MENINSIKFATWNIDQARREEGYENTKFDTRWDKIYEYITKLDADILCLQELRNLETSKIKVNDLLYYISKLGYDYKHVYYGPDDISFALAIFYKRDKFFVSNVFSHLLPIPNNIKENMSKVILRLNLTCIKSKKSFVVCNTHLGLDEVEKSLAVSYLSNRFLKNIGSFLCAGDYNFFDDRRGIEQRNDMLSNSIDLAFPLENIIGTFMGYNHDEFKQPFEKMSRLDHVFSNGIKRIGDFASVYGDIEMIKNRTYPSDHLLIYFSFVIE